MLNYDSSWATQLEYHQLLTTLQRHPEKHIQLMATVNAIVVLEGVLLQPRTLAYKAMMTF